MIHWQRARRELVGIPILVCIETTQVAINSNRLDDFFRPVFFLILL
jgi:hypothetical protein